MRAVVSRVSSASVTVAGVLVAELPAPGLLTLVGVTHTDSPTTARELARKIHGLRILDGDLSTADTGAPILVVSQFTLYGSTRKGRRPSWSAAAPSEQAEPLVRAVVADLEELGATVLTGRFGADMQVASVNSGPFTLLIEL